MKYYTELNTVMPLGAYFPSKIVFLVFGSTLYKFMY